MSLMRRLAFSDSMTPLEKRIEYLSDAINSAKLTCQYPDLGNPQHKFPGEVLTELSDKKRIAELQLKILDYLKSELIEEQRGISAGLIDSNQPNTQAYMENLTHLIRRVDYSLLDASELYNQVIQPFFN